jgi:hypothetical protein
MTETIVENERGGERMKRGSAKILPPDLAYRARGRGTVVVCTTGFRIGSDRFDIGSHK